MSVPFNGDVREAEKTAREQKLAQLIEMNRPLLTELVQKLQPKTRPSR